MTTPFPFVAGTVLTAAKLNAITTLPINDQTASYVALVGDVGKRIVMNVASANTVTINNSVFATGDTIFIANKGAGATTVTAGAGVTINTAGSLVIAQHGGGTLVATSASVFTFFSGAGNLYGVATGGTSSSITVGGVAYTMLTFTSSGTLTVTKSGLMDVLMVGGGASGGFRTSAGSAGGGGGGGVVEQTFYADTNQTVTVGAKGIAVTVTGTSGNRGTFSRVGSIAAGGAGGGCANDNIASGVIDAPGSGGGGIGSNAGFARTTGGLTLISTQGNNGGDGSTASGTSGSAVAEVQPQLDLTEAQRQVVQAAQEQRPQHSQAEQL